MTARILRRASDTSHLALLAALALVVACGRERSAPLPDNPRALELLARPTLDGATLDLAPLEGRVVVVNFWSPG